MHILRSYHFYGATCLRTVQSMDPPGYVLLCPKMEKHSQLPKPCASLKKIRQTEFPTLQKKYFQLISVIMYFLFWISWAFKIGLIACLKTSVTNYHSMLHNIPQECRLHLMIWRRRPWFGSALYGSELSEFCAVRFSTSYINLRRPHIFKCQI